MWRQIGFRITRRIAWRSLPWRQKRLVHLFHYNKPLHLELGKSLPEVHIQWEQWGPVNAGGDRTIIVMPALSASSHTASSPEDPEPGWWEAIVGPGKAIDTNKYRVISASGLGSPFGSTSPLAIDPRTHKRYRRHFPQITPKDQAACYKLLLDHLGISNVYCVVGSSLGGMQALQFVANYPSLAERFICISSTAKTSPGTVALRRVQRRIIANDPNYKHGEYEEGKGPTEGMAIARELGTITYRSRHEFNQRFSWDIVGDDPHFSRPVFEIEHYLESKGKKFVRHFDANCYLLLSRCMDLQDIGRGFQSVEEGLRRIKARAYIIGVSHDYLIPIDEQERIVKVLKKNGNDVRFDVLDSMFGHDAFLLDTEWFSQRISAFFATQ